MTGYERKGSMRMGMLVVLGLASILFLSTILIVAALMIRGRWEKLGQPDERPANERQKQGR